MASRHNTFTLNSTTPTQITGITDTASQRRGMVIVLNTNKNNAKACLIGSDNTVSSSNFGWHADANQTLVLQGEFTYHDTLWAIAEAGSPVLHVLVMGG